MAASSWWCGGGAAFLFAEVGGRVGGGWSQPTRVSRWEMDLAFRVRRRKAGLGDVVGVGGGMGGAAGGGIDEVDVRDG